MSYTECFAYNNGKCKVLTVNRCKSACSFYKTDKQYNADYQKARKRIHGLPYETLLDIKEAYGGVWDND